MENTSKLLVREPIPLRQRLKYLFTTQMTWDETEFLPRLNPDFNNELLIPYKQCHDIWGKTTASHEVPSDKSYNRKVLAAGGIPKIPVKYMLDYFDINFAMNSLRFGGFRGIGASPAWICCPKGILIKPVRGASGSGLIHICLNENESQLKITYTHAGDSRPTHRQYLLPYKNTPEDKDTLEKYLLHINPYLHQDSISIEPYITNSRVMEPYDCPPTQLNTFRVVTYKAEGETPFVWLAFLKQSRKHHMKNNSIPNVADQLCYAGNGMSWVGLNSGTLHPYRHPKFTPLFLDSKYKLLPPTILSEIQKLALKTAKLFDTRLLGLDIAVVDDEDGNPKPLVIEVNMKPNLVNIQRIVPSHLSDSLLRDLHNLAYYGTLPSR